MDDGEVTRVELGAGRRRWWPVAIGILAAWVVLAAVFAGGGDDRGAAPTSTTSTSTPTTEPRRSTTTTTDLVLGAPVLGRLTGWHLVVSQVPGVADGRVVELDTGATRTFRGTLFGPPRVDGVFTQNRTAGVLWRPFPFTDGSEVFLGPAANGGVFAVAGTDTAWLALGESAAVNDARLVSLVDGAPLASVQLPPESRVLGATGDGIVVTAGGDTFRVGTDGAAARLSTGIAALLLRGEVVVRSCDENLRCGMTLVDVATGAARSILGVGGDDSVFTAGPTHPDGRVTAIVGDPNRPFEGAVLLGPEGAVPLLPEDMRGTDLSGSAWSPDGALLFVPRSGAIDVVDPFAPSGPTVVTSFALRNVAQAQIAVVQPRTED